MRAYVRVWPISHQAISHLAYEEYRRIVKEWADSPWHSSIWKANPCKFDMHEQSRGAFGLSMKVLLHKRRTDDQVAHRVDGRFRSNVLIQSPLRSSKKKKKDRISSLINYLVSQSVSKSIKQSIHSVNPFSQSIQSIHSVNESISKSIPSVHSEMKPWHLMAKYLYSPWRACHAYVQTWALREQCLHPWPLDENAAPFRWTAAQMSDFPLLKQA